MLRSAWPLALLKELIDNALDSCELHAALVRRHTADGWEGERVELNAIDSVQFLRWLRERLEAAGVRKVVPNPAVLAATYWQAWRLARLQQLLAEVTMQARDTEIALPSDLDEIIRTRLGEQPARA